MQIFDTITIAHDESSWQIAHTLRASLECARVRSHVTYCVQAGNVTEILAAPPACATHASLVLCMHGIGESDGPSDRPEDLRTGFVVVTQRSGRWQRTQFELTPANIAARVHAAGWNVINLGCGGGRRQIAEAFLAGGVASYIGANQEIDEHATARFVATCFYHLLAADRGQPPCSDAAAFARAAAIDEQTAHFRYHPAAPTGPDTARSGR